MNGADLDSLTPDESIVQYIGYAPNKGHDERIAHQNLRDQMNQRAIVRRVLGTNVSIQFSSETHAWDGKEAQIHYSFLDLDQREFITPADLMEELEQHGAAQDLRAWWLDRASEEVEPMIAKMEEYSGGTDRDNNLVNLGRQMLAAGVGTPTEKHDAYAAELAVYFYVQGKMARWAAAVAAGRFVSDDTLLDIGVYIRMVQRIRTTGGWPN